MTVLRTWAWFGISEKYRLSEKFLDFSDSL